MILVIVAGTVMAYLPGMGAGFYFDDEPNILEVPALHWSGWSFSGVRDVLVKAKDPRRFVANFSFALNHLIGGLQPAGYHWTNLVIHLAVGAGLFWVIFLYVTRAREDAARRQWALVSSLLMTAVFLLHPLNIQAVTYVVQRMTSLSALFVLLSFGHYLSARRMAPGRGRMLLFGISALCWMLAVGSKEIALALPVVVLLYEASREGRLLRWYTAARRRASTAAVRCGIPMVVIVTLFASAIFAVYYSPDLFTWETSLPGRDYSGYERVLTQAGVQLFYLRLLAWPAPGSLNLDHGYAPAVSLFEPATAAAVAFWLVVLIGAVRLTVIKPRYGFPLLAYLMFHVIESGPINLELVFEHRMYLPMTMLALLGAGMLTDLPERFHLPVGVAIMAAMIALGTATYRRNETWADPIVFLSDCAAKSPGKFRPLYNLGSELGKRGRYVDAEIVLNKALQIKPADSQVYNQLGNVNLMMKRPDEAFALYTKAVTVDPSNAEAVYNLATRLEARGRTDEARELYRRFVKIAPPWLEAYRKRVSAMMRSRP